MANLRILTELDICNCEASVSDLEEEVKEIEEIIGISDDDTIGLQVDFENCIFTRLGAAKGLNAGSDFDKFNMYGGRKRCTVEDDGTISSWYGDENFAEDGSMGQVMVYQPKFYYKVAPLKIGENDCGEYVIKANYYLSDNARNGFKLHPAFYDINDNELDYILIGAYEDLQKQ